MSRVVFLPWLISPVQDELLIHFTHEGVYSPVTFRNPVGTDLTVTPNCPAMVFTGDLIHSDRPCLGISFLYRQPLSWYIVL